MAYPDGFGRCIMCGVDRGERCVVISGSDEDGDRPGDPRPWPHSARARPGQTDPQPGFIAVRDEPPYAD